MTSKNTKNKSQEVTETSSENSPKSKYLTFKKESTNLERMTHTKGGKLKSVKTLKKMISSELKDSSEFWDDVFELRRKGVRITKIAKTYHVPYSTFYKWLQEPEIKARLIEAEEQIADNLIDENIVVAEELLKPNKDGTISPHNARVATDINFKVASAFSPSKYGDKKQIEIKQDVRTQHVLQLRELHEKNKLKDVTPERLKLNDSDKSGSDNA